MEMKKDKKTKITKKNPVSKKTFFGKGRRKEALAQVRIFLKEDKGFLVNGKNFDFYFSTFSSREKALKSLIILKLKDRFDFEAKIKGSGINSQAEALSLALSRALIKCNPIWKKRLKKENCLKPDLRTKERKKYGLKGARKAPQWAKR